MRLFLAGAMALLLSLSANAQPQRQPLTVTVPGGKVLVEGFGDCGRANCPAVLILSGSRGFAAQAYDDLGKTLQAAGLNAYLVHVLSQADLAAIAGASGAKARIAYQDQQRADWVASVQAVARFLKNQPRHGGKTAILGISLGAQTASAASAGNDAIDALVLVDGGFPNGYSKPVQSLPPLLLIWGSNDKVFPHSIGQKLHETAQKLGGPSQLAVYEGGGHDFFLKSGTQDAVEAHRQAAEFLADYLNR